MAEEILGQDTVQGLRLKNVRSGEEKTLQVAGVFIAVGIIPQTELLDGLADRNDGGYVLAGEDGITSAEGIFAAGDCRSKNLRQIITAVADGANEIMMLYYLTDVINL